MHELSIVKALVELCEKEAKNNEVEKISIAIGKMSGVEPHFLKESFDIFKESSLLCKNAILQMDIEDVKIRCNECKKKSKVTGFDFYCPYCKSPNTKIVEGQQMYVKYIEVKENL